MGGIDHISREKLIQQVGELSLNLDNRHLSLLRGGIRNEFIVGQTFTKSRAKILPAYQTDTDTGFLS